jgi:hypothetical protein
MDTEVDDQGRIPRELRNWDRFGIFSLTNLETQGSLRKPRINGKEGLTKWQKQSTTLKR